MKKTISIKTDKLFTNITSEIQNSCSEWGGSGIVNVFQRHTTSAVRILEDELLHHVDVRFWLDKYLPKNKPDNRRYMHDLISLRNDVNPDERINAYSHMRSLYFNTSETIPVEKGKLMLGKWQDIFFIELDPGNDSDSNRDREIICTFIKE